MTSPGFLSYLDAPWHNLDTRLHNRKTGAYYTGIALVLAFATFVLLSITESGYSGDDSPSSIIPMHIRYQGITVWDFIRQQNEFWMETYGRFFPTSIAETTLIFTTFLSRAAYKYLQIASVLLDLVLLIVFVRRLTASRATALLAGATAVVTLQMRLFHDPILQFSIQQPTIVAFMFGSLICFDIAIVKRRYVWLVPSVILWVAALTTYETTYLLFPAYLVMLVFRRPDRPTRIMAGTAVAVPAILLGMFVVYLRLNAQGEAPQYTTNTDPDRVLSTFAVQTTAALPLSYAAVNVNEGVIERFDHAWEVTAPDLLIFIAFAGMFAALLWKLPVVSKRTISWLAVLGAGLWTAPALVVATTHKWQEELEPGTGYVSVYPEYFGFVLASTAGLLALVRVFRGRPKTIPAVGIVALSVLGSFAVQVTADNNDRVVAGFSSLRYTRDMFERSIDRGVFSLLKPGDRAAANPLSPWTHPSFISYFGASKFDIVQEPATPRMVRREKLITPECEAGRTNCRYMIVQTYETPKRGRIAVATLNAIRSTGAPNGLTALSRDLSIYFEREDYDGSKSDVSLTAAWWFPNSAADRPISYALSEEEFDVVDSGPGWGIVRIRLAKGLVASDSITIEPASSR